MHDKQTAKAQALLATKAQLCRPKLSKASNTTPPSQPPYRSFGPNGTATYLIGHPDAPRLFHGDPDHAQIIHAILDA